ncbi:MAG: serine hydrolase domain-containing protein [Cyclobacteriaceae bacterium]|jgi:CubicO group peptidase (beta-lactamase class C family)|nr:beta-lactamase family protein [Flammeovirgaceae bacterium]
MKAFQNSLLMLLISLLIGSCNPKPAEQPKTFADRVDSVMTTVPDFSGVLLIAQKGKPVYHKAFGYRNFETKIPIDTASIFELASVSKQFTAAIIMLLKEENLLTYDDPIEKYLADLPYKNITIRQLLNHTSGLPDYQAIMDEHWDKSKVANNNDILEYLKKYHPPAMFAPGEKYNYSNTGYVLLASIAEKASGKDFIQLCRDRIFTPLAMSSTNIRTLAEKASIDNFALGHIFMEEKKRFVRADSFPSSNYTIWLGNRKGPGRISSTASDLLKWDQSLYTNQVLKQETLEEAFTPAKLNNDSLSYYGFGWEIKPDGEGKIVLHSGDNPGYKTEIIRHLGENKTLIILCNNAHRKFPELVATLNSLLEKK